MFLGVVTLENLCANSELGLLHLHSNSTDALIASCLEASGVAGAWIQCDFNQQQETFQGGRLEEGEVNAAALIFLLLLHSYFLPAPAAPQISNQLA